MNPNYVKNVFNAKTDARVRPNGLMPIMMVKV